MARPDEVDAITNLDTARMTLRWALERLRALEGANRTLEAQTRSLEEDLARSRKEAELLRAGGPVKAEGELDRSAYYQSMERLLSDYCKGDFDVSTYLRQAEEAEKVRRQSAEACAQAERDYAARRAELEEEYRRLRRELEAKARLELDSGTKASDERRRQWEKDISSRETLLRSAQAHLASQEKDIEERRQALEREYTERKVRAQAEYARLRDRLEEEHRLRVESWEQEKRLRQGEKEKAWDAERNLLREKAEGWEKKAQEYLLRIMDLEEELLRVDSENFKRIETLESRFRKELRSLSLRRELWEKERLHREGDLGAERAAMEDSVSRWRSELEATLMRRFQDAEEEARRREARWAEREKELADRDRTWHEHQFRLQQELSEKAKNIEKLKRTLLETIAAYRSGGKPPEGPQ